MQKIDSARKAGQVVTANQYPYTASKTSLIAAIVPRWAENGGLETLRQRIEDPSLKNRIEAEITENIRRRGGPSSLVLTNVKDSSLHFRSLEEIAIDMKLSPSQTTMRLIESGESPGVVSHNMKEADVIYFMQQPWVMTGSDGGSSHPRKNSSFTRKIRKYVMEEKVLSLAEMIRLSTSLMAEVLGIVERGKIAEGYFADILLFDPKTITDKATFEAPGLYSEGVQYVWVNGELTIDQAKYTEVLAGRALRKEQK